MKSLRADKRIFLSEERELKRAEYLRLLKTAQTAKNARLYYSMQTLAADLNNDGKVNPLDKIILARHLADWQGYETLPYTK